MVEVLNIESSVYRIIHELRTNKKTKRYYSENPVIAVVGDDEEYIKRLREYFQRPGIVVKQIKPKNLESLLSKLYEENPTLSGVLVKDANPKEIFQILPYIYDIDSAYPIEIENYHESLNCRDEAIKRFKEEYGDQPFVIVTDDNIPKTPEKYTLVDARFTIGELNESPLPEEVYKNATSVINLKGLTLGILFERAYRVYFKEVIPKLEEKGLREQLYGFAAELFRKSEEFMREAELKQRWEVFKRRWKQKANK